MSDNNYDDREALEELRHLIMGQDLDKLDQLSSQIEVPDNLSSVVANVLPEAMIKSAQQGNQLSEAMVPTVEEIVRLSIKKTSTNLPMHCFQSLALQSENQFLKRFDK
jgi:hypothetical protein